MVNDPKCGSSTHLVNRLLQSYEDTARKRWESGWTFSRHHADEVVSPTATPISSLAPKNTPTIATALSSTSIPLPTPTSVDCDGGVNTTGPSKTLTFSKFTMNDDCVIVGDSFKGNFDFKDETAKNVEWSNGAVFAFSTKQLTVKQYDWFITDGEYALVPRVKAKSEFCDRVKQLYNQKSPDGGKSAFGNAYPLPEWGFSATDLVSKGQCP